MLKFFLPLLQDLDGKGDSPPQEKPQHGGQEAIVDQVDAVKHLGAAGAREGLADAEELLVLSCTVSSLASFPHS